MSFTSRPPRPRSGSRTSPRRPPTSPHSREVRAFLGLGSNLGDRLANLQRAVDLLGSRDGIEVVRSSRVYETEPVGGPDQPDFLNAVVEASTVLTPLNLLASCLSIEWEMGRIRAEQWGPRMIDVDVLTYDRETIREPSLVVPHPRMHRRAFVLAPLLELDPVPPLPEGATLATLALPDQGVRLFAPALPIR